MEFPVWSPSLSRTAVLRRCPKSCLRLAIRRKAHHLEGRSQLEDHNSENRGWRRTPELARCSWGVRLLVCISGRIRASIGRYPVRGGQWAIEAADKLCSWSRRKRSTARRPTTPLGVSEERRGRPCVYLSYSPGRE